jgi:predicted AAA+ superfamily ATPase
MKQRLLFYEIVELIEHKNAIVVAGMRQVGKTTLLKQVFAHIGAKPKLWFDFDNPLDQKIFEDIEYRNIYARLREMVAIPEGGRLNVFIDEIQNFPEITKVIKYLIDHFGVKFFVTGSSNFYLKNIFPESLSGRKFLYDLPPLTFGEYLYFHDKLDLGAARASRDPALFHGGQTIAQFKAREVEYAQYLRYGGFPEVVLSQGEALKMQVLKNIFSSFFEKDLRLLSDYADVRELRDLILLLVPRVGSMIDVTKLASELGVPRAKIYAYLEFLQGVFFIRLLSKFSLSVDRSVAAGKKVYFTDTGLLRVIGNVNDAQLFENAVVNQLARYGGLSFYRKRNVAEIDAVLDKKIAFEVKLKGDEQDYKKLARLAEGLAITPGRIISRDYVESPHIISGNMIL